MKRLIVLVLIVLFLLPSIPAPSLCPLNNIVSRPYYTVTTSPKVKHAKSPVEVEVLYVDPPKPGKPTRTTIAVRYLKDNKVMSSKSYSTNSQGIARFIPQKEGDYSIIAKGRNIRFKVYGPLPSHGSSATNAHTSDKGKAGKSGSSDNAGSNSDTGEAQQNQAGVNSGPECGNDKCEKGESRSNCLIDCARCGDSYCDAIEDPTSCPRDCSRCGDGICDQTESKITCPKDCVTCGDGVCGVNENAENCPNDCKLHSSESAFEWVREDIIQNKFFLVILLIIVILVLFRDDIRDYLPEKKHSRSKPVSPYLSLRNGWSREIEDDREKLKKVISDLLDDGISEKVIRKKLKGSGLTQAEIGRLIKEVR